jgi:hypothetical protein
LEPLSVKGKSEAILAYELKDILPLSLKVREHALQLVHEGGV